MQDTLVFWDIPTLNRTKANPFPLEHRTWWLQWNLVPEHLKGLILKILVSAPQDKNRQSEIGDEEWTLMVQKPDPRMLLFRKYFTYDPNFDINEYKMALGTTPWRTLSVNLYFEYFEDETANPITKIEIHRFKTGEVHPIIPYEPESVLQLGPSGTRNNVEITQNDSDTISHFLEIAAFLSGSSWYRSPLALTFRTQSDNTEMESTFPNQNEMIEVILGIRQLYASDEVFNRAENCYTKICGESRKVNWIGDIKNSFNTFLNNSDSSPLMKGVTSRGLLDAFLYGSRIVHAGEQLQQEQWKLLLATHGRASVMMTVQMFLRRVVDLARLINPVLKQDYQHWIEIGKCPKPSVISMGELFASRKENVTRD